MFGNWLLQINLIEFSRWLHSQTIYWRIYVYKIYSPKYVTSMYYELMYKILFHVEIWCFQTFAEWYDIMHGIWKKIILTKICGNVYNYTCNRSLCKPLTHLPLDKMAAISQTTFSNAFSWIKIYEFRLKLHWSLLIRVQWKYASIGSDNGLAPTRRQAIIWTNVNPVQWRIYALLGGDMLTPP